MSLKKDFLEEISVGDSIIVVYAQHREVTGRVLINLKNTEYYVTNTGHISGVELLVANSKI